MIVHKQPNHCRFCMCANGASETDIICFKCYGRMLKRAALNAAGLRSDTHVTCLLLTSSMYCTRRCQSGRWVDHPATSDIQPSREARPWSPSSLNHSQMFCQGGRGELEPTRARCRLERADMLIPVSFFLGKTSGLIRQTVRGPQNNSINSMFSFYTDLFLRSKKPQHVLFLRTVLHIL